jgi:hypothetical protein
MLASIYKVNVQVWGNRVAGYACVASFLHCNALNLFTWLELNHSFISNVPMQFPNFSSLITVNEYYEVILKHITTVPSKLYFMSIYVIAEVENGEVIKQNKTSRNNMDVPKY